MVHLFLGNIFCLAFKFICPNCSHYLSLNTEKHLLAYEIRSSTILKDIRHILFTILAILKM